MFAAALNRIMSYDKLSSMLNIPLTALSKYVNGHIIPSLETTHLIFNIFKREYLMNEVNNRIVV